MKDALINMKPTNLEDIIALVALYRPGPMSNIPIYNECKNGKREPDYIHPHLEEILKPTYGVIIYQEQVMQIAQKLSGFSAAEADILRKAIGKKKRTEVEKQKIRFIDGAVKNGIPKDVAAGIFLKIEPFAEYGFNKSHAAAYAIIAYQTAYLKTYYPNEFFAASMTMDISNQKKLGEFYEEIKRLNIDVIRPDINKCYANFRSDKNKLFYALGGIKNVGFEAVSNIVNERLKNGNFKSISDFINRVSSKDINKLQLEGLIKAGAFDSINKNRSSLFKSVPNLILKSKNINENKINNQINLFENNDNDSEILNSESDWDFNERLNKEFDSVGFFISDHPLNQYKDYFPQFEILNYQDFSNLPDETEKNIAATILKIQERKTNKGNSYAVIKFSDLNSFFELFLFSDILENNRHILKEGNSVLLKLNKSINNETNQKRINIKNIISMSEILKRPINSISFILNNYSELEKITKYLEREGKTKVSIKYKLEDRIVTFDLKNKRDISQKSINLLKKDKISINFA